MWINAFPCSAGFSQRWSPQELICRHKLDIEKHYKTPFRTYCEVHNEPDASNSIVLCTQPAIAMGPTGNIQGSYKYLCLKEGKNCIASLDWGANGNVSHWYGKQNRKKRMGHDQSDVYEEK